MSKKQRFQSEIQWNWRYFAFLQGGCGENHAIPEGLGRVRRRVFYVVAVIKKSTLKERVGLAGAAIPFYQAQLKRKAYLSKKIVHYYYF
jgi:hypothetical protein